ncbi:hypothetical protein [Microbacterium sp.]|uniref:hypothetical protein n=1 Tax=Microbacterium sp. TaxID=51671 RepID=UPI003F9DEF25
MSDELEITHGGAIAVDSDALRGVADALAVLAPRFADAASAIRRAHGCLLALPMASMRVDTVALWGSVDRVDALHEECRVAGENTRLMADVYELVEHRAELAALAIQERPPSNALLDRIAELEASDPRVVEMETWLLAGWEKRRTEGLHAQFDLGAFWVTPEAGPNMGLLLGAAALGAAGVGRLPPYAALSGRGDPVSVTPVRTTAPIGPPNSIAEALRRFPGESGAQIKVEKYAMADGSNRFVLYSKGTQPKSLIDWNEPFDMKSNLELYTGQESASYVATVDALRAAGAQAGDEVQIYAHSQAAMNAAYLASGSEFDVTVQVTAGSPVQPTLDDDQLLIELRHTDDMVNSLAGGGPPAGTGSADSLVVTRVGDPEPHIHDVWLHPHMMESYTETAELLDASDDVRLEAWRDKARELTDAVSIESTEYVARRD